MSLLTLLVLVNGCTPAGPRALLEGKKLIEQGKYPQAIERLKVATALLGSNAQAWNYLGLAYHHSRQVTPAENAYQRALFLNRDLSEAHFNLGCLWLEQGKSVAARNELTAYVLRHTSSREGMVKLGLAQLGARDLALAEKTFGEVLRLNPENSQGLNGLGLIRIQQRRPAEAAQFFQRVLKHDPNFAPALLNLAIVLQQYLKQPEAALQKYRQYLALKPTPQNAEGVKLVLTQLELDQKAPAAGFATSNRSSLTVTNSFTVQR